MPVNSGRHKQLVAVEQYDGAEWQAHFDWYCAVTHVPGGGGAERVFTAEGRWREEFETMAGLDHHSEGFRLIYNPRPAVQRKLLIDEIVLPEDHGDPVTLSCHEVAE